MLKGRRSRIVVLLVCTVFAAGYLNHSAGAKDWRTASREPAGFAPDPAQTPEAVVQVYAARAVGWRGYFGVHTGLPQSAPARRNSRSTK